MRALVLALALLNVLFFGWSHWIDQPDVGRVSNGAVAALRLDTRVSLIGRIQQLLDLS